MPFITPIPNLHSKIYAKIISSNALDTNSFFVQSIAQYRADRVISIAGDEGSLFEDKYGQLMAGSLICLASYPNEIVPDFYVSNHTVLADMKKLADNEMQK